nr:capZ-interacting protein-like [Oncorhynchus nerka]
MPCLSSCGQIEPQSQLCIRGEIKMLPRKIQKVGPPSPQRKALGSRKDSSVKPSVAELAGRFKDHVMSTPTPHDERKPVKRRPPPCFLQLHDVKHDHGELEKPSIVSPHPPKSKMKTSKSSPLIEKLQVSVSLSVCCCPCLGLAGLRSDKDIV